jgi:exonuclease III
MANNDVPLHQGDDIVLNPEFDFSNSIFDLNEPDIPTLNNNFTTPSHEINLKFKNYENLAKLAHVNARSVPKHVHEIEKIISETKLDVLGVSETFISKHTPTSLYQIPGYKFINKSRDKKCRGGIGIYVQENFPVKLIKMSTELVQPEMLFVEVTIGNIKMAIGVIYKSPLIPYSVYAAIHENLSAITNKYEHFLIMGDMNINHLLPDSSPCKFFTTYVTEPFAFTQVITDPTRITATTSTLIDLMLTSCPENVKVQGVVDTPGISDHCLTFIAYSLKKPKFKAKMVTRRDFRNFDKDAFLRDMSLAPWGNIEAVDDNDIDNKVTIFENIHKDIIDKHAPFRTFRVTRPAAPWLTNDIKELMDNRDRYKNKFNRDKRPETELLFKDLRNQVTHAIRKSKIKCFNDRINTKIKDPKQFHQALKNFSVVQSKICNNDPCHINPTTLNEAFLKNNNSKVNDTLVTDEVNEILKKSKEPAFSFSEVTVGQVIKMVRTIKSNACGVDSISAYFLKLGIEHSVYAFTDIINASLKFNIFPERWKLALVKPLPKIANPVVAADYRPISLLPAFSKILEKLVARQMVGYLKATGYLDNLQSAYKQSHSTITALLNVTDDIYEALENSELTFLVLLDYSKAFDCANHRLILAKLKAAGFQDNSLSWITSYLSGRSQKVVTGSEESCWESVINGVPQGSVLGPLLFTILVSDIGDAIKRGRYHLYADDTQLYYKCKVEDANTTIANINSDLQNIFDYSKRNCLKLNASKSKFIVIGSRPNLKKLKNTVLDNIYLGPDIIEREHAVKNLGIMFDEYFSWSKHVNLITAKAYGKLRHAYRFKNFLSPQAKWNLSETYILSQFNYGDIVLQGLSNQLVQKIQKIQNSCIRFSFGLRKYDHITATRKSNKIICMESRRQHHCLSLMFKITKNIAPIYLCNRIKYRNTLHNHNTRRKNDIVIPFARSATRSSSFFIEIANKFNVLTGHIDVSDITLSTFKTKCRNYLRDKEDN